MDSSESVKHGTQLRAVFILIALLGLVAFMPVPEIAKRPRKPREMHHGMPVIIDAPDKSGNHLNQPPTAGEYRHLRKRLMCASIAHQPVSERPHTV